MAGNSPADHERRGDCPCGTNTHTPPGWCGLIHHGLGCHHTNAPLTDVPHHPGSPATVTVCTRCAARAHWWLTDPSDRPRTREGGPLGHVLIMDDGTRTPIGEKPRHITF
ncbi:hypothetical protein ACFV42_23845 [Streptomyces solisilvae]|uniref:hypothetical protein n=1 Tax=Streptomyces malaysiensis TaxID=92644 RepID=UPI0036C6D305